MNPPKPKLLALSTTGIVLATLAGLAYVDSGSTAQMRYFDPVLNTPPGGFCLPNGSGGKALLGYYLKVAAAKTETRPFPTQIDAPASGSYESTDPPLWDNLGTLSFRITTANPLAQRYFDQGLRLAFGFNHAEARRAFRKAQKLDPECAMCYWGEALVLGPHINAPMEQSAIAPAMAAVRAAQAKAGRASAREQALIAAVAARYSDDPKADRPALDKAYADAMGKAAGRFPDDPNILALYAESLMDLSPWDYWEAGGSRPKGRTAEILATLERILAANPDHPGAIHFYIHMVEASTHPERAEPYARRLAAQMPGAGHVVHMPFHIYFRIGQFKDALEANKEAVKVDEAYLAQVAPEGLYPMAYYPHNVHSLMASAQMAGDRQSAVAAADKLGNIVGDDIARQVPLAQPIRIAPYFVHAQFSKPEVVLALPAPGPGLPLVTAMWHYARGVAQAEQGKPDEADREAQAIAELGKSADFKDVIGAGIPAPDILELSRHVVRARAAQARHDFKSAQAEFEAAVAVEDKLAYMEPPYWYYPVRQSLGAVLLQAGKPAEAEAVFRASLARVPNNGWALFGLAQTYRRLGKLQAAAEVEKRFENAWAGDRGMLDLARL